LKFIKTLFLCFTAFILATQPLAANAQSETPKLPVYIVQSGDTLNLISIKFNVSAEDIIAANGLADPNVLQVNMQLIIPGIEGAEGVLSFEPVKLGETPIQLARVYGINLSTLYKLNRITSPSEFFLGSNVILVNNESDETDKSILSLKSSGTIFESAILNNYNPWDVATNNQITYPWELLPNENFVAPLADAEFDNQIIKFDKLPLVQGRASSIVLNTPSAEAKASLDGMEINFYDRGNYSVAIFGPHSMKAPGLYPFHLEYNAITSERVSIDQLIILESGYYVEDPMLYVDPETLDTPQTKAEEEQITQIVSQKTNEKYWNGLFRVPVDEPVCIKSWFGNRRAYNGGTYDRFHAGVDYGVCANLNIYAPADGVVVFAGPLTVRGNATIIDHGLGVFSGFWHQSKQFVEVGQTVKAGDLIGEIGTTGRSTGPHLHWEVITNGIQVEPLDWLDTEFP
jgi:murein DD-endopeptidase MepM/ murein hydrolase activator NlpD